VGPLDDAFFIYSEEADWCRRIRNSGWRCVFAPEARILHLEGGSQSTSQIKSRMHVQKQKSKLTYLRKHHGVSGVVAGWLIFVCSSALRFLLSLFRFDMNGVARRRLSLASLRYLFLGREPTS